MDIIDLCDAISQSMCVLNNRKKGNHTAVKQFQDTMWKELCKSGSNWKKEYKDPTRLENDTIDLYLDDPWIIEIDATRADQVAKKILSRIALWGKEPDFHYVAVLYPDTRNGKNECKKFIRFGREILKRLNRNSEMVGIFLDPNKNEIEIEDGHNSHFMVSSQVKGKLMSKNCNSMVDAAVEAMNQYLNVHSVNFSTLQKAWSPTFAPLGTNSSRPRSIGRKTTNGVAVYVYTQFRGYGKYSTWQKFVKRSKKLGIYIVKLRKIYDPSKKTFVYKQ